MTSNIIDLAFETRTPFIYLHMHKINDELLSAAIKANGSIEIDVSVDESGELFIGHPHSFYEYKNLDLPDNLPLDFVIDAIQDTNLIVVIDCKDVRAVDWIRKTIARLGVHRVIVHAWVDTLLFKPYDVTLDIEPNWIYEDLPLNVLEKLHEDTDVSIIISSRGLSNAYIAAHYDHVIEMILLSTKNTSAAMNLNLPNNEVPSRKLTAELMKSKILTLQNIDKVSSGALPLTYIGMTDDLNAQTTLQ